MSRSFRARLRRLQRLLPPPAPERPSVAAILESGERIARVNGQWVLWPYDRPLAKCCKMYGFNPDDPDMTSWNGDQP